MPWWKLDEVSQEEFDRWISEVACAERRAKRDANVINSRAFVIYEQDGRLYYAPGDVAPSGAYRVERWQLTKRGWKMEDGR